MYIIYIYFGCWFIWKSVIYFSFFSFLQLMHLFDFFSSNDMFIYPMLPSQLPLAKSTREIKCFIPNFDCFIFVSFFISKIARHIAGLVMLPWYLIGMTVWHHNTTLSLLPVWKAVMIKGLCNGKASTTWLSLKKKN